MPIVTLSSEQALAYRKRSRALWPTRTRNEAHLYPIALPEHAGLFALDHSDRIFCIGSCFAREIEAVLRREGFSVLSLPSAHDGSQEPDPSPNVYTVAAIHHVVCGSLGVGTGGTAPFEETYARLFARLREASVLIITLGLSEVWFDRQRDVYLNEMPSVRALRNSPERYELRVLDFSETLTLLSSTIHVVNEQLPGCRVLLTVSPVPMYGSFRADDVFLSNAYSKSVLRACVDHVRVAFPAVDYFPSYEMATLSDHRLVWGDADYRHVDREFVSVIVNHAMASLFPAERSKFERTRDASKALLLAKLDDPEPGTRVARVLEATLIERLLGPRKLRKYTRGRDAFFEDSRSPVVRLYGRLTRRRG